MAGTEVVRHVAADAAGVALLLSGPAAYDLWPQADDTTMTARAPMRSGIGFVVDLSVDDDTLGAVRARVAITPAGGATTSLRLSASAAEASEGALRERAARFLDALARQAQARSSAA
jgi:hypothetical protein